MTHSYKGGWAVTGDRKSLRVDVNPWSVDPKTIDFELMGSPEGSGYIWIWNGSNTGPHLFFKVFSLCLNDLTPSPISRPGTHCLQWQPANARAPESCECDDDTRLFPAKPTSLRPGTGKAWVAKRSWWCLGIIASDRCCQFSMIILIMEEIHL